MSNAMTSNLDAVTLTSLARYAISQALRQPAMAPDTAGLDADGASFVTLTQGGLLRGCIGSLQAWRPLRDDIVDNAVSAALHDPRFPPLTVSELPDTHIEVSVLSVATPMPFTSKQDALSRLRPGVDGVILYVGRHRATFLPQVWEELPDPELFIGHLMRKAGLAPDYWSDKVEISRYTVTAFHEDS